MVKLIFASLLLSSLAIAADKPVAAKAEKKAPAATKPAAEKLSDQEITAIKEAVSLQEKSELQARNVVLSVRLSHLLGPKDTWDDKGVIIREAKK